jgi:hypothetical protein
MILKIDFLLKSSHGNYHTIITRLDFWHSYGLVGRFVHANKMELLSCAMGTRQTNHADRLHTMRTFDILAYFSATLTT